MYDVLGASKHLRPGRANLIDGLRCHANVTSSYAAFARPTNYVNNATIKHNSQQCHWIVFHGGVRVM